MKNIISKIMFVMIAIVGFASFGVAHANAAQFANDGSVNSVVLVSNYTNNPGCSTCWSTSVSAQPGDIVSVLVYYHNVGNDGAINTRVFINPFSGANTNFNITGGVSASNANTITGSSNITINGSAQTLTYIPGTTKWYKDQTVVTGLLNGQSGAEIIGGGLNLGMIQGLPCSTQGYTFCHQGSVVARFQVSGNVQSTYACNDGIDNDGDNKIDYPNDPGCYSSTDNDEYDFIQQGQAPTATTTSATNITTTSATINGNFNSNGYTTYTHFEWGSTYSLGTSTPSINQGVGSGITQAFLSNLSTGATYYYKLCAVNAYGTVCGSTLSFTTIPTQSYACNDGIDNDGDNKIDYPNDPGCSSLYDTDEYNYVQPTVYACNDNIDNDGDGKIDYPNDPGCSSYYDTDEYNYVQPTTYACNDGYDNDGDGKVDMNDPGCTSYYDNDEYNYTQTGTMPSVATLLATSITQNSARVNGTIVNNSSSAATVWFEWGTSYSLGFTTNTQTLAGYNCSAICMPTPYGNSQSFSDSLYNLAPNTYYYFRAVGQNSYGTSRGDIYYFKTSATYVPVVNNIVYVNDETPTTPGNPLLTLVIDSRYESFAPGDNVDYTVTYTNTSSKTTLKDAILHIQFPAHFEFVRSNRGEYSLSDNTLTLDIGEIDPQDEDSFYIEGVAKTSAINGDLFVTSGTMTYIIPKNIQEEVIAYSLDRVNARNNLSLFALGIGMFPGTLLGWLIIILVILAIVLAIRSLSKKEDKNIIGLPGARRIE